jgi:pyruvate formate lyase activating enzyme
MMQTFKIYGYNSISEAGFPDIICPVIFVNGCNMKCPYCMNSKLVTGQMDEIDIDKTIKEMKKNDEDAVLISGGEPCAYPELNDLIDYLKKKNFQVLLSTNSSCPHVVKELIENKKISFIAADIKTGFLNKEKWNMISNDPNITNKVLETIDIIGSSDIGHEFRTTLYPPLVNIDDLESIAQSINPSSALILQQFRNKANMLDQDVAEAAEPYDRPTLREFLTIAKKYVDRVNVRYT